MNYNQDIVPYNRQPSTMPMTGMPMTGMPMTSMPMQLPPTGTSAPTVGPGPYTSAIPITMPSSQAPTPIVATGATLGGAQIAPQTLQSTMFTPGYLVTQIGKKVRVEFLIGTTSMTDRIGTLVGVGASYILILLEETDDILLADLYSIKFVTFYH